ILQKTLADHRNTLMITSPLPEDGKTLPAINLALSISQELAQTVLLIDVDLRAPSIHQYFGLPAEPGLVDYLEGQASIPEILVHPQGINSLVVLPGGKPTEWAAELIRSPRMAELVPELKHCYPDRYVIFDLPPVLSYADALAFAPLVDSIVLVVAARQTSREDLSQCVEMLQAYPILGYVLNKVEKLNTSRYYRDYKRNGQPKRWFSKFKPER
ncbi:MAG: CpsD/CapB family tyrosine-protein kinase, partial [Desulfobacca sp.]|nr:CpsD/CapB family tyrosine-protein kinase [Desulfobacca sp.]